MASGDTFVIGDYEYTVNSSTNPTVSAKVVDTTKTAYADIPQTVTNDGTEYTVTRLGSCFSGCSNMVNPPSIPNTVTYMYSCFYGCSSMAGTPNVPSGVSGSMVYCFRNCSSMVNPPSIPSGVTNLNSCFNGCSSLVNPPSIPSGVTTMTACFNNCSSLIAMPRIPDSVTAICTASGSGCFGHCTSLVNVSTISANVTNLESCFYGCSSLVEPPSIPSGVTNMKYCFANCTSLETAPEIPYGVEEMYGCFQTCSSLVNAPSIPASVTRMSRCFFQCSSLVTPPPTLPDGITNLDQCFSYCKSLLTAPAIPSGVTELSRPGYSGCFQGCTSLVSAPAIPANVTVMANVFKDCYSLTGSIVVMNTPTEYRYLFNKTRNPIYIVPMGGADPAVWKAIAAQYDNVIFMSDANSKPALAFSVTRVAASGDTAEDVEGGWAHVVASATAYMDALPDGYTNDVGALTTTLNDSSISPTWTQVSRTVGDYKVTVVREAWVAVTNARQLFAISVVDSYNAQSAVITVKLPSTSLLWDLHAGGDGLTIGRRATGAGFAVAMDSAFEYDVDIGGALSFDGETAYPLFVSSSVPTGSSAYGLDKCFVYCTADGGLYYCTG